MQTSGKLVFVATLLLTTAPLAIAQTRPAESPPAGTSQMQQTQRVSTQDFVNQAWNIDMAEIEAARAVEPKVTDASFRDFAQMIQRDHTRMNDELKSIASKQNLTLPKSLDQTHQQKLQQLTSASGQNLERSFRTQQVEGHQQAIKLFQSYAADGDNADLRNFAKTSLATLEQHLDRAQALREPSGTM